MIWNNFDMQHCLISLPKIMVTRPLCRELYYAFNNEIGIAMGQLIIKAGHYAILLRNSAINLLRFALLSKINAEFTLRF